MDADQFQDLYKLLRGSREAIAVLDARALFNENKLLAAWEKISEARETFAESHFRVLKQSPEQQLDPKARDADRQLKKLKRKQEKTIEIVKAFDEMLPQLNKLVERQQRRIELEESREAAAENENSTPLSEPPVSLDTASEKTASDETTSEGAASDETTCEGTASDQTTCERAGETVARSGDLSDALIQSLRQAPQEQLLDLINRHFGFREVHSEHDIHGDALYYVQTKTTAILACTPDADQLESSIQLISAIDGRTIKPFSREAFLKLGTTRKMVLLTLREARDETAAQSADESEEQGVQELTDESVDDAVGQHILDLGAFSQLLTSAQRSGLVPEADQIGYVRDREFRLGKYDLAFQTVDAMFTRFMSSAGQRAQTLAREDADIAAGRIKISPKDLLAKRARERSQTQEIERAKRRFGVVLEGLRALMNTTS